MVCFLIFTVCCSFSNEKETEKIKSIDGMIALACFLCTYIIQKGFFSYCSTNPTRHKVCKVVVKENFTKKKENHANEFYAVVMSYFILSWRLWLSRIFAFMTFLMYRSSRNILRNFLLLLNLFMKPKPRIISKFCNFYKLSLK